MRSFFYINFFLLIVVCFCVQTVSGEQLPVTAEVRGIAEDKDKIIWIASEDGIFSYDGTNWSKFTSEETGKPGDRADTFRAVAVDQDNVKWFGFISPVLSFDGETWTSYTDEGPYEYSVSCIAVDHDNIKWFGTLGGGVWSYDGETWTQYTTFNSGLASAGVSENNGVVTDFGNTITGIAVDSNNMMWFSSYGGASCYDGENWLSYEETSTGLSIYVDRENYVWFGHIKSTLRYNGTEWETALSNLSSVYSFDEDSNGYLWTSSMINYDGENWYRHIIDTSDLAERPIHFYKIFFDSHNTAWLGTDTGLLHYDYETLESVAKLYVDAKISTSYIDDTSTIHHISGDMQTYDNVAALAEDYTGNIWCATVDNGVGQFDGSAWTLYNTLTSGIISNSTRALVVDGNNMVWVGTDAGISRFDGSEWTTFTSGDGLADDDVRALALDKDGTLWIGTMNGVSHYIGSEWRTFGTEDGLADSEIISIAVDDNNVKWFGGNTSGVTRYDGDTMSIFTTKNGLFDNHVPSIAVYDDIVLFATGIISVYDGERWKYVSTDTRLGSNDIFNVYIDKGGNRWYGSRTTDLYYSVGPRFTESVKIRYDVFGRDVKVFMIDSSDRWWIGTSTGLSCYDSENPVTAVTEHDQLPQPLTITGVYPNPFNPSTTITFSMEMSESVTLSVYDINGRKVRELVKGSYSPGIHRSVWDGKDENGVPVSSGVYFTVLRAGKITASRKMLLMK